MKRKIFAFLLVLLLLEANLAKADWVTNWLDSAVVEGPTAIEGATRNYFSAGGAYIRWKTGNLQPISVAPPRLRIGCGGIDAFWGSLSILDFDYAVERLKKIMYSAAPFAFEYALGRMCEKCKQIMNAIEASANFLNQISINECDASRAIAIYSLDKVMEPPPEEIKNKEASLSQILGIDESYWKYTKRLWERAISGSGDIPPDPQITEKMDDTCPSSFAGMFSSGRVVSILHYLADKGIIDSNFESLIRALVGDVSIVSNSASSGGGLKPLFLPPCYRTASEEDIIQALLNDEQPICTIDEVLANRRCLCTKKFPGNSIRDYVNIKLTQYVQDLSNKDKPTADISQFMGILIKYSYQFPVYNVIRQAYIMDIPLTSVVSSNSIVTSCASAIYARALLENALSFAQYARTMINEMENECGKVSDTSRCLVCEKEFLSTLKNQIVYLDNEAKRISNLYSKALDVALRKECREALAISKNMQDLQTISAKWAFGWMMSH